MTIADRGQDGGCIVKGACELPLLTRLVGFRFQHYRLHHFEVVRADVVLADNHSFNG